MLTREDKDRCWEIALSGIDNLLTKADLEASCEKESVDFLSHVVECWKSLEPQTEEPMPQAQSEYLQEKQEQFTLSRATKVTKSSQHK